MNIREQLINVGVQESEIATHESDLHVPVNEASTKWLSTYEFKSNVRVFFYNGKRWYDIPFGYMNEHYANRFK